MLLFVFLSLISVHYGSRCNNETTTKQGTDKFPVVNEVNKTVGQSSLKLTFFNFNSETDEVNNENSTKVEFKISMVRYREAMPSTGVPFKFFVEDENSKQYKCYEPIPPKSKPEDFQSLKSEVLGNTSNSKDFFLRVYKSSQSCSAGNPSSNINVATSTTASFTTSSPKEYLEILVFLSVKIIEPLEVQVDSISDNAVRVSVNNLKSKDKTSPDVQCFMNGVEITKSPHFKILNKLKESSGRKDSSTYVKEENEVRTMTIKMKCWSDVYSGPLTCSARMSGYTYWSNPLYLSKRGDLSDCEQNSRLTMFKWEESSGITRLAWDCKEKHSSYMVHINQTVADGDKPESCPLRLKTRDTSCSLETDQLKPGIRYKVWVTSASSLLVVDVTLLVVDVSDQRRSDQRQIMLSVLVGLGAVVMAVAGFLLWRSRRRRSRKWSESEVQNLNKENLEMYETSDIVILHITNSEVM